MNRGLILGIAVSVVVTALTIILSPAILGFFDMEPDVEKLAISYMRILSLGMLFFSIMMVSSAALRGAGDTRTPMIVTLVGTMLFRVPLTYLFVLVLDGGLSGVWLATAVDWSMRSLVLCLLYLRGRWKTITV